MKQFYWWKERKNEPPIYGKYEAEGAEKGMSQIAVLAIAGHTSHGPFHRTNGLVEKNKSCDTSLASECVLCTSLTSAGISVCQIAIRPLKLEENKRLFVVFCAEQV